MTYQNVIQPPVTMQSTQNSRYVKTLLQSVDTLNLQLSEVLKENEAMRNLIIAILTQEKEIRLSDTLLATVQFKKGAVTTEYDLETRTTLVKLQSHE